MESVLQEKDKTKKIREIITVKNRIQMMSQDFEEKLLESFFALQCDDTTEEAQYFQLFVFVRFLVRF